MRMNGDFADPALWRDDVREAVRVMNEGGVILYPTDTIWGIGCDATNVEAVERVYEIKKRSDSKIRRRKCSRMWKMCQKWHGIWLNCQRNR